MRWRPGHGSTSKTESAARRYGWRVLNINGMRPSTPDMRTTICRASAVGCVRHIQAMRGDEGAHFGRDSILINGSGRMCGALRRKRREPSLIHARHGPSTCNFHSSTLFVTCMTGKCVVADRYVPSAPEELQAGTASFTPPAWATACAAVHDSLAPGACDLFTSRRRTRSKVARRPRFVLDEPSTECCGRGCQRRGCWSSSRAPCQRMLRARKAAAVGCKIRAQAAVGRGRALRGRIRTRERRRAHPVDDAPISVGAEARQPLAGRRSRLRAGDGDRDGEPGGQRRPLSRYATSKGGCPRRLHLFSLYHYFIAHPHRRAPQKHTAAKPTATEPLASLRPLLLSQFRRSRQTSRALAHPSLSRHQLEARRPSRFGAARGGDEGGGGGGGGAPHPHRAKARLAPRRALRARRARGRYWPVEGQAQGRKDGRRPAEQQAEQPERSERRSGSNDSRSSKAGKKKATTSGHPSQGR